MSSQKTILKISDLTIVKLRERHFWSSLGRRNDTKARVGYLVNGMNLIIHKNQIHGVVGESGSGKTLTMKSIMGLIDFSPGIVYGKIRYYTKDDAVSVLPDDLLLGNNARLGLKRKFLRFLPGYDVHITEYFTVSEDDLGIEVKHVPKTSSIRMFSIESDSLRWRRERFEPPSEVDSKFLRLKQLRSAGQVLGVSYIHTSRYSRNRMRKEIDQVQRRSRLRGQRIAMVLQDPQTFLNPYWSIEKQVKNLLAKHRRETANLLINERNFTIRIFGSRDDFPVRMSYDRGSMQRNLRQAELWVRGVRYDLLGSKDIPPIDGISHFWGIRSVGRKFQIEIHPQPDDYPCSVRWDRQLLRSKLQSGTITLLSSQTRRTENLLATSELRMSRKDNALDDVIRLGIELILGSGENFSFPIAISYSQGEIDLTLGLEEGATEGLDIDKGEIPIHIPRDKFFAGLVIDDAETKKKFLCHKDIRSPADIMIAEATLTITPKFAQDFVGQLSFKSNQRKAQKTISFGLVSDVLEKQHNDVGERDISQRLKEGYFYVGFVIGSRVEDKIYSYKDYRDSRTLVDIDKDVSTLLSKVDLDDKEGQFKKQLPREISGGQGERVMISLSMASKPELLIADEPTTGLDVTKQKEIVNLFQQYKEQGRTIVLISHDLNFIRHLADQYTIVYAGCDVEHVSHRDLLRGERIHPYTKRLLSIAGSGRHDKFEFIPGDVPSPYRLDFSGCPFAPRCIGEKEKIPPNDDGLHICDFLLPPLIDSETGNWVDFASEENLSSQHLVRCWLFAKNNKGIQLV